MKQIRHQNAVTNVDIRGEIKKYKIKNVKIAVKFNISNLSTNK